MENKVDQGDRGAIGVVARSALILRLLGDIPTGLSLGDISRKIGLARSTVQRLVNALEEEGLVMCGAGAGRISLGPEFMRLAKSARPVIMDRVHPLMEKLSDAIGETVDFSVVQHSRIVFLDQIAGKHRLLAVSHIGDSFPLYCSSVGKAYLAALEDQDVKRILGEHYPKRTEQTIAEFPALCRALALIRKTGIGIDEEEHSEGICALGVAFEGVAGDWFGISIPMPVGRFREKQSKAKDLLRMMLPDIQIAATGLS